MTIRLATAATCASSAIVRRVFTPQLQRPANDNLDAVCEESMVWEALRHFGEHGLQAATRAAEAALSAHQAGDQCGAGHWLTICRVLDSRLGDRLAGSMAADA